MWLINHRVEYTDDQQIDVSAAARWREDGVCVERDPRKSPDGTERWFRAPTLLEAAGFWKIPNSTISHWWRTKEKIFGGTVPQPEIPLVHPRERNGEPPYIPDDSPPREPSRQGPRGQASSTPQMAEALQRAQQLAYQISHGQDAPQHPQHPAAYRPAAPTYQYEQPVYPQAAQPTGPPLHPLYRANFAVEEVSKEVAQMVQNQHSVHLQNLLRALALSQALVNDLTEAHKVLLNPQSYPQYYPPGFVQQAPPPPPPLPHQPYPWPQAHPGRPPPTHGPPAPQPSPQARQQPPVQHSRTPDGRYIAIQAAPYQAQTQAHHPLTPVHTPNQQTFPPGQAAGQHKWLLQHAHPHPAQQQQGPRQDELPTAQPVPPLRPKTADPADEPDELGYTAEELARLKHKFANSRGEEAPERPIVLPEVEDGARGGKGPSQGSSPGTGQDEDTAMADDGDGRDGAGERMASDAHARPDDEVGDDRQDREVSKARDAEEEETSPRTEEDEQRVSRGSEAGEYGGNHGGRGADEGHEPVGGSGSGHAPSIMDARPRTSQADEVAASKSPIDRQIANQPAAEQITREESGETAIPAEEVVVPREQKGEQEDVVMADTPLSVNLSSADNKDIKQED